YHVLLGTPTVEPTQTVNVPAGLWTEAHIIGSSVVFGIVDVNFFSSVVIPELLTRLAIQPGTLPIFLDADTYLSVGGHSRLLHRRVSRLNGRPHPDRP